MDEWTRKRRNLRTILGLVRSAVVTNITLHNDVDEENADGERIYPCNDCIKRHTADCRVLALHT